MSTVLSWTDVGDLRSLLAFRASSLDVKRRRRLCVAFGVVLGITVSAIVVPAYSPGAVNGPAAGKLIAILPSIYLGFLVLAVVSASASGGGRELVPREQAVAWPITPTTDHLGSLLLAPLNVAWMLQAWTLLGMTTYVTGPTRLWATVLTVALYVVLATALGQIVAWTLEWARRGPGGRFVVRGLTVGFVALLTTLVITHKLAVVLDHSPTVHVFVAAIDVRIITWQHWAMPTLVVGVMAAAAVVAGAFPATWASRRAAREEHRLETGIFGPRPDSRSDLWALVRINRASVWRSVPLRRGLVVLAVMPGAIAFAGHMPWTRLTILPGLVASGGALLFGVNSWCLDGRGGLWRQSLPVAPGPMFLARVWVLAEILLASALLTIVLGAVRAGMPTRENLLAVACCTLAVVAMVVSASMRWSVARPFAVDMRSARATPAPPVVMVGYSTRLALATTFVGLIFSGLAETSSMKYTVLIAAFLVLVSAYRTARTARRWEDPKTRARVVVTVAG